MVNTIGMKYPHIPIVECISFGDLLVVLIGTEGHSVREIGREADNVGICKWNWGSADALYKACSPIEESLMERDRGKY